jgi:hypothetical protein
MKPTFTIRYLEYLHTRNKPTARYGVEKLSTMLSRGEFITDYEKTLVASYAIKQRNKKKKIN